MSRQFATMINSGLSLLRALTILVGADREQGAGQRPDRRPRRRRDRAALSAAHGQAPQASFPPLMVNMIRAGEIGGFLDSVLLQLAENYEAEVKLRGKIKSAMTYPVVVFVIAILAVIGMLLFIVPVFAQCSPTSAARFPHPRECWCS